MDSLDDPHLQNKIAKIRETLQKMGSSYTEDETSEIYKSGYSSDSSHKPPFQYYSPKAANLLQSAKSPTVAQNTDICTSKSRLAQEFLKKHSESNHLKGLDSSSELIKLKSKAQQLTTQISSLQDQLQVKEKELHKAIFEKNLHLKAEEELKKMLEQYRTREVGILEQLNISKRQKDLIESEKKLLAKSLEDSRATIEKLLKQKDSPLNQRTTSPDLQLDFKAFDLQRLKIPERVSPTSPVAPNLTDRDDSYKALCEEAMKIVGARSAKDLYPRLLHLKQYHSKFKKAKNLLDRVTEMIVQCSPEGAFKEPPSVRQVWRWITRLLEEYMRLKQSVEGGLLNYIVELLKVEDIEEIVPALAQILNLDQE